MEPLIVEQNNSVHASQFWTTGFSVWKKNSNLKLFINIVNNLEFQITETELISVYNLERVAVKAFLMKSKFLISWKEAFKQNS